MPLNIGSRLGHYDVTALIGEGGMGGTKRGGSDSLCGSGGRWFESSHPDQLIP